jgi:Bacterial Ig-like domain/Bacterial Ig domain
VFQGVGLPLVQNQEASAQVDMPSIFGNPGSTDFLSLAVAIMPTIQGADLNVSNVPGSTDCDLLVPITYIDGGCMTSLPLLTPFTVQANITEPVNETVYYTDYNQSAILAVSIGLSSDNITAGDTQTVTVTVSDENSTEPVSGAVVNSNITDSYGTGAYEYSGTTDEAGQASFDYAIPSDALSDFYDVTVYASADGYDNATSSTAFEVIGSDSDLFYDNFDNSTFDESTSDDYNYDDGSSSDDCCNDNNDDFDSPTVKSVDPQDGENNVPLNTEIKVTFDESMDQDTLDDGSLRIFNLDTGVDPDVNANPSSKSVTYTLDRQLEPGTSYEAELDFDIQDQDGNFLDCTDSNDVDSSCRWQFETTGTSTGSAITRNPASGPIGTTVTITGTDFDPSQTVEITFDGDPVTTNPVIVTTNTNGDILATTFVVPPSSSGSKDIVVTDGFNSASKPFNVTSALTINTNQQLSTNLSNVSSIENLSNQSDSSVMNATTQTESNRTTEDLSTTTSETLVDGVNQSDASTSSDSGSKVPDSATNDTEPVTSELSSDSTAGNEAPADDSIRQPTDNQSSNFDTKSASESTVETKTSSESAEQNRENRALFEKWEQVVDSEINNRPVAKSDEAVTIQNVPVSIDILANDKDADDKDEIKIIGVSPPQRGKVDLNSNDGITYLPEKEWTGTDVFDYTISDGNGGIAMASVAVTVGQAENHVPISESETISVNENNPERIKLKASDADGRDRLMFKIVKEPSHGKIAEFSSSDGTLIYLPDRNYEGKDSFEFIVTDGKSESKEGQITIEIKPGKDLVQTEQATDQNQQSQQQEQKEQPNQPLEKQDDKASDQGNNAEDAEKDQPSTSEQDKEEPQEDQPKEEQQSEAPEEDKSSSENGSSDNNQGSTS